VLLAASLAALLLVSSSLLRAPRNPLHGSEPVSLQSDGLETPAANSTEAAELARLEECFLRARGHHIQAENGTHSACPSWQDTLPGAWQVAGVEANRGAALFGTGWVQQEIYRHQHVDDCDSARFLVHRMKPAGIGSIIHQATIALSAAMDLGRVLLFEDQTDIVYMADDHCWGHRALDTCYFLPLSNCQFADLHLDESIPVVNKEDDTQQKLRFLRELHGRSWSKKTVPQQFYPLLEDSGIPPAKRYYWWRAQAATYILRPNKNTEDSLRDLREAAFSGDHDLSEAISVHVRRGDKWRENKPVPNEAYDGAAQRMLEGASGDTCRPLRRRLFVSSDDAAAVEYFRDETEWTVEVADLGIYKPNTTMSSVEYAQELGAAKDMFGSLLNLQLALECGGFVGTLSSNWCRLIDELRSTIGCKADAPFLDVAQGDDPSTYKLFNR